MEAQKQVVQKNAGQKPAVPMGSWLGFHDRENPTLAKLVAYDRETDAYIFVNRDGLVIRRIGQQELRRLIIDKTVEKLNVAD